MFWARRLKPPAAQVHILIDYLFSPSIGYSLPPQAGKPYMDVHFALCTEAPGRGVQIGLKSSCTQFAKLYTLALHPLRGGAFFYLAQRQFSLMTGLVLELTEII